MNCCNTLKISLQFNPHSLVSFQANKTRAVYRWYKYKEAFSASLVEYLFAKYGITKGRILDPFAGSGTALFATSEIGINADGIELLPIGQQIISTKKLLDSEFTSDDFNTSKRWSEKRLWEQSEARHSLLELRITKGAYPEQTRERIEKYLYQILLRYYFKYYPVPYRFFEGHRR